MGEFLEFIRQQHLKTMGKKKNGGKRLKPPAERLEHDSVSEVTDLSNEDILSTSQQILSTKEKAQLDKYNEMFRRIVRSQAPKHNCFADVPKEKRARINNSRYVVNMELRAKSEPRAFEDGENSAHQFSVRSKSIQADSEERNEIAMQTEAIDLKSMNQQVDIYDLDQKRDAGVQGPISNIVIKMKDQGTMMEPNRRFLVSQDWFFSILFRETLIKFFKKLG